MNHAPSRLLRALLLSAALLLAPAAARADFALRLPRGTNDLAVSEVCPGALLTGSLSTLAVAGGVGRDCFAFARDFRLFPEAAVRGDARFLATAATLEGTVSGDATGAAQSLRLAPGGKIAGDALFLAQSLVAEGAVEGECVFVAREATLSGTFGGDVRVQADKLRVAPGTRIAGKLTYVHCPRPVLDESVAIAGGLEEADSLFPALAPAPSGGVSFQAALLSALQSWCGAILVGMFFFWLFPGFMLAATFEISSRPLRCAATGFVASLLCPAFSFACLFLFGGIPLALVLSAFCGIGAYLAHVVVAFWAALGVLRARGAARIRAFWAMAAGLAAWHLLSVVPVLAAPLYFLAILFGTGGLVRALLARRLPRSGAMG